MNELTEYLDQKSEIERLNKQINVIAGFYRNFYKEEIEKLKRKAEFHRTQKYKAFKSRDKLIAKKETTMNLLSRLKVEGALNIEVERIAEISFCSKKSVIQKISRIKKGQRND